VGGGVESADQARRLVALGVDRIVLGAAFWDSPRLAEDCARAIGAQAVIIAAPCKLGEQGLLRLCGQRRNFVPLSDAQLGVLGSGAVSEVLVQSVLSDGATAGIDLQMFARADEVMPVPLIVAGGMSNINALCAVVRLPRVSAVSLGNTTSIRELALDDARRALGDRLREVPDASSLRRAKR
jgi:cyclase